ncbi:ATP-dependent RNA helicase HrpA [Parahaliea aestuarii]|uniref:ATP-dependent RNA helicase HrpA n=1 Tax=Parahaliea aestuarii TaxID=1852021 RepID=A0A5C8ZY31_9GAMM|nr:ATP-dependent RNA helicase HrpA [Parahaliea aestuarii]TXS93406.1 ATP-dependent RNA helicase HrpA [Parahaliea aestuarii]
MQDSETSERRIPPIRFPADLPVAERREEIMAAIRDHQVVVVAGETGSGKTTQLPKICLELGRGRRQRIGHTQPRRLAARTVAQRIAAELDTSLGETVGYQVRFNDQVSEASAVKLMTDGILLAEIQRDRLLRQYDTLIIDEAHERSLNIDFLLGYLKNILPRRPDLKLIITSATIDLESFSRHFDDAPVIEVSGRTYPVETVYLDPVEDRDQGVQEQIVQVVQEIAAGHYGERGDTLVFLPGERDIRELAKALRRDTELDILPLYARLSQGEQQRVFDTSGRRGLRVVLATNVAETSVTVPGIRYVIDPGEARISRYSYRTKVQRLPIEPISQASANQRQGRCGRVAAGVCIRLYSREDFERRPEFTDPEIRRTNLAAVILQMLNLRLGDLKHFPFIDPPDPRMVRDGYKLLEELGAVTPAGKLTDTGRQMSRLPLDPRLGRMILAAAGQQCLGEMLVIASALSIQDPRERPADRQQQSDQSHARFKHEKSDFMAWLNLWRYYEEQRQTLSQNQLRKLCQKEFLSFLRLREWRDTHYQLTVACRQQGLKPPRELPQEENYNGVHQALLAGLLGNIAQFQEGRDYLGARNRKLQIFPGSSQARKKPKWLVAAEIVETSNVFARVVGGIDPRWALTVNPDLLKHHYYEPRWQPRGGRAVAYERITLYGLTLSDKQTVNYGPIDPVESRELLIREGLVAGRMQPPPAFLKHNQRLLRELQDLESRTRRRDIVADEEVLFRFYDERLPADITTLRHLNSWVKRQPDAEGVLQVPRELLLARDPGQLENQFPNHLAWDGLELKLSYQFEPGGEADGVTVTVPVALLNRVPRHLFDYLVPGLLRDKCIALVKALPKSLRKQLVPVPDYVDRALAQIAPGEAPLLQALAQTLSKQSGQRLSADDWQGVALEDFYRMNIRVVDSRGKVMAQGRDLDELVARFRQDTKESVGSAGRNSPARDKVTQWDMGNLPREWRFRQAGVEIVSYPALVDRGEHAAVELLDYPGQATLAHRQGVLRLLRLHNAKQVKFLRKEILRSNADQLALAGAGLEREALVDDLIDAAYVQALDLQQAPRSEGEFNALLQRAGAPVVQAANELETLLRNALTPLSSARQGLAKLKGGQFDTARRDIDAQLQVLLAPGFLRDTPGNWLAQYPRYMKALAQRVERLNGQLDKDQRNSGLLSALWQPLAEAMAARPGLLLLCAAASEYRWMHEEFRVSLFAQQLGTRLPVSQKRLESQWQAVEQWLAQHPR